MIREGRRMNMAHRIPPPAVIVIAFLTFAGLAQGQEKKYVPYTGGSSSGASTNATATSSQHDRHQQDYGSYEQGQYRNTNQGMPGPPAQQNPNQNGSKH